MTSDSLVDLVDRAIDGFPSYAGEERFEAEGAVFVRDRSIPDRYYANRVEQVTASTPEEIARLSRCVEVEFKGFRHRSFYVDRDTPTEFEAWLLMEGYQRSDSLVMVLTDELRGAPKPHEIRLVETDADWQAYYDLIVTADRESDSRAPQVGDGRASDARDQRIAMLQSVSPPVRYWLAYAEGAPRAFFSSWISSDGIAVLDFLYTHPDYRRRGLASALIHHCVADCRARGAGPVALETDPSDDIPKLMYAAMGFRPLSVSYEYLKTFE